MAGATFAGSNGRIVFEDGSNQGIYTISSSGANRKFLVDGFNPSWSPNGEWIVFTTVNALKLIRPDGTGLHTVINSRAHPVWEPAFSPTGGRIVYRRGKYRDGSGDLWMVTTHGLNNHLLLNNGANPDWSEPTANAPLGTIAFDRFDAASPCHTTDVYTVLPDGSDQQLLPFGCEASSQPSWNPKPRQLAFAAYAPSGTQQTDIYTGDTAGASRSQLTNLPDYDVSPAYSPNGASVVFSEGLAGSGGLYRVSLRKPLTAIAIPNTKSVSGYRPDWQPQ